jgi:hypothetical protein
MKQFTRFWSLCGGYCFLAILLFASCNANDDDLSNNSKENTDKVTLLLNITPDGWNNQTTTRASYSTLAEGSSGNKTFNMTFQSGDAIGLFVCDKTGKVVTANLKFTYNGSAWNTEDPIEYVTGLGSYTFFAYYPWVSSLIGAPAVNSTPDLTSADTFFASAISSWTPAADQSNVTKFTAQDLMVAKGTNSMPYFHEVQVAFNLAHKMGLLITKSSLDYYDIDDPSDTWSEEQTFSPNIPYALNGLCYFFAKPNTATTLGSKTATVASGQVEQLYFTNGEPSHR